MTGQRFESASVPHVRAFVGSGRKRQDGQRVHSQLGVAYRREQQSKREQLEFGGDMIVATFRRELQTSARTIQYDIRNMRHGTTSSTGGRILPEAASIVLIQIKFSDCMPMSRIGTEESPIP
jgi:hypothetical protein